MKRRRFPSRREQSTENPALHHHVYVVLLDEAARQDFKLRRDNPAADPAKPCLYVGLTGLDPAERFANHKQGLKASGIVQRHGVRLLPKLYQHLNPMPYAAAVQIEMDLAEDLRALGHAVAGGH